MQLLSKKPKTYIGLIGHTIINYPSAEEAKDIIDILVTNNAELIELQIPFSEPVADGPLFTKANYDVILQGITLDECYAFMSEVSSRYPIPFVFMTYANIVFKQGYKNFIQQAKAAGAKGAIIPDLPLDVAGDYLSICREENFAAIPVISPNISSERLHEISPFFDGFIYAVARSGVTGMKTKFDEAVIRYLDRLKKYSDLAVAIGFGIATGDDLAFLRGSADYAVIGTETLRAYQAEGLAGVKKLWQMLNNARMIEGQK